MKSIEHLFKTLRPLSAPIGLAREIVERIRAEERHAARRRVAIFAPILVASVLGIAWGIERTAATMLETGLMEYVSLALTDPTSVASVWYQYLLTIIEALPIFALSILVGASLLFVISVAETAANAKRAVLL